MAETCPVCPFSCLETRQLKFHYAYNHMVRSRFECLECPTVSFETNEEAVYHVLETHLDKDYAILAHAPSSSGVHLKNKAKKEKKQQLQHPPKVKIKSEYDDGTDFIDDDAPDPGLGYDEEDVGMEQDMREPLDDSWLNEEIFTCPFCNLTAEEEEVQEHITYCEKNAHYHVINAKPTRFKCKTCNKDHENEKQLNDHNKSEHPGVRPYKCPLCDKDLTTRNVLMTHFKNVHMQPNKIKAKCEDCGETFNKDKNFMEHMKKIHNNTRPYLCKVCNVGYNSKNGLKIHVRSVHSREQLKCEADADCGETFFYQTQLENHYKANHPDFKVNHCFICNTSYGSSYMYKRHVATGHSNRHSTCKFCDTVFTTHQLLDDHYKKDHGISEPYDCSICGKTFAMKYSMEKHVDAHSKKPRIQCNYCSECFAYYTDFEKHTYEAHGISNAYQCHTCNLNFSTKHYLTVHLSSPECIAVKKCDLCGAQFMNYNDMMEHRGSAHVEKKKCSFCDFSHEIKEQVDKHKMSAHPELMTRFKCKFCDKSYPAKSSLAVHKRIIHYMEPEVENEADAELCEEEVKDPRKDDA